VGDDNCGVLARAADHLIVVGGGHCSPGKLLEKLIVNQLSIEIVKSIHDFTSRKNFRLNPFIAAAHRSAH